MKLTWRGLILTLTWTFSMLSKQTSKSRLMSKKIMTFDANFWIGNKCKMLCNVWHQSSWLQSCNLQSSFCHHPWCFAAWCLMMMWNSGNKLFVLRFRGDSKSLIVFYGVKTVGPPRLELSFLPLNCCLSVSFIARKNFYCIAKRAERKRRRWK